MSFCTNHEIFWLLEAVVIIFRFTGDFSSSWMEYWNGIGCVSAATAGQEQAAQSPADEAGLHSLYILFPVIYNAFWLD